MMQELGVLNILAMEAISSTKTGADVSTVGYIGHGGREIKAIFRALPTGGDSNETADAKLQESPTTVSSDFTDVTGGGFTQVVQPGTAAVIETIHCQLLPDSKYLRGVVTLAGTTPTFTVDMTAIMLKRVA